MEYSSLVGLFLNEDVDSIAHGILSSLDPGTSTGDEDDDLSRVQEKLSELCLKLKDARFTTRHDSAQDPRNAFDGVVEDDTPTPPCHSSMWDEREDTEMENTECSEFTEKSPVIPLEVLRQVAQSGYLSSKDMGRLLLLTSAAISNQLGHNFIWGCLCSSLFPNLTSYPSLSAYSEEWIFRQFSKPVAAPSREWPPLSPPMLSEQSLVVFLQWFSAKTDPTPIATIQIPAESLHVLLNEGDVVIPSFAIPQISFSYGDLHKIHLRVVCLRQDRRQACCLHETGEFSWDLIHERQPFSITSVASILHPPPPSHHASRPPPAAAAVVDLEDEDQDGTNAFEQEEECLYETANLYFGPKTPVVLEEESGRDLESRLARGDRDVGGFELLVVANVVRPKIATPNYDKNDKSCGASSNPENDLPWTVKGLTLQFWANYSEMLYVFNTGREVQKHGVTMLHVLDQLHGWKESQ